MKKGKLNSRKLQGEQNSRGQHQAVGSDGALLNFKLRFLMRILYLMKDDFKVYGICYKGKN